MNLPRTTSDRERRSLKTATSRLIDQCGGLKSAASITRVSYQTLGDYGNSGHPKHVDVFMPVDVLADLSRDRVAAGERPVLLDTLCRLAGGAFVQLPGTGTQSAWAHELGAAVREGGEAAAVICQALADDGHVSATEIRKNRIVEEISEAIEALAALRAHCLAVQEGE